MTIREVTMYRVQCDADGCTASPTDGGEYVAWSDHDGALADLDDAWDWYTGVRGHLCPDHAPTCLHDGCRAPIRKDDAGVLCEDHQEVKAKRFGWVRPAADGCVDGHTFKAKCELAPIDPGPWDSTRMGTTG